MAKRKGQFKKGGGRIGGGHAKRRKSSAMTHAPRTRTITRTRTRTVTKHAKRRRHGKHGGGGMKLTHLAVASAGLAFLTGAKTPIKALTDFADKIPGTKTFGAPAMVGIACLAADRFIKPNRWLKLLGTAGIVLAAVKIGTEGTDFKFLGDESAGTGDVGDYDLADESGDIGDDDMGDDMGDDE